MNMPSESFRETCEHCYVRRLKSDLFFADDKVLKGSCPTRRSFARNAVKHQDALLTLKAHLVVCWRSAVKCFYA